MLTKPEEDKSFFNRERDRLAGEIATVCNFFFSIVVLLLLITTVIFFFALPAPFTLHGFETMNGD
jgi:hypothetical protein